MRVVVGSPSHQTFFFQDEIETVEFNPYWGVPQSIIVNEMLPKLRQDPSYLDRLGYQVEVSGRAVSSTQVDWNASTQNVSVRQPPSSDNALGDLKILFPMLMRSTCMTPRKRASSSATCALSAMAACVWQSRARWQLRFSASPKRTSTIVLRRRRTLPFRSAALPGLCRLLHGLAEQGWEGRVF